jgi:hypothetical protein
MVFARRLMVNRSWFMAATVGYVAAIIHEPSTMNY